MNSRLALAVGLILCSTGVGLGQPVEPSTAFRPEVSITIKKHRMGADEFEVTLLDGKYDQKRLLAQIQAVGKGLGALPRGITISMESLDPSKPQLNFLKARFAIDGVINAEQGSLKVDPILKGFMDGLEPPIQSIQILFVGVKPSAENIQRLSTAAIQADGYYSNDPVGLEYRVTLKSQDPRSFTFPDKLVERTKPPAPSSGPSGISPVVLGLIGVAGVSAGVLVYSLLRGGGSRPRAR